MKKAKILLFGLVLSVLGICSFSNAYTFLVDKNTTFNGISTVDGYHTIGQLQKYSDSDVCVSVHFLPSYGCNGTRNLNVGFFNKSITTSSFFECGSASDFFRSSDSSSSVQISFGDNCEYEITFTQKASTEGLSPNGIGDLTPVITGLTNSINEFIPYMVYIGLGVLGVVIGFFAIKRLMRYVKGSTLSVFSSRKKRK